jgi:sulfur carrier protein ThiS adenylyltransferase
VDTVFQEMLPHYFSAGEIKAIGSVKIGIAGLGGLGSNAAMNLARCGFIDFVGVDFDHVEATNLNRQAYYPRHVGRLKCDCLAELLSDLNPAIIFRKHAVRLAADTIKSIFAECDVIIEAFDDPACKALIVSAFMHSGKLLVSASGIAGHGESDRIIVRKIHDRFYLIGDAVSAVGEGMKPYAPCVAIAAAKQADVVLDWVLKNHRAL